MTRLEFMKELESLLLDIPLDERNEALTYYNGYFDDAGEEQEEEIVKELGSPEKVAAIIKADLNIDSADLESKGFFTERGYQEAITSEFELAKTESSQPDQKQAEQSNHNSPADRINPSQAGYSSQAAYSNQEAYNAHVNNDTNQTNSDYINSSINNNEARYSSNQNGNGKEWKNNQWESNNRSNNNGYNGSSNYGYQNYSDTGREKGGSGITMRILLIIVTFPIWLPIAATVISIAIAVIATLFGLIFGLGVTGVSLIGAGVILFLAGLAELATPFYGLVAMGGGLLILSIGMLITIGVGFLCKKVVPVMVNGFVNLCRLPFKNRRAMA